MVPSVMSPGRLDRRAGAWLRARLGRGPRAERTARLAAAALGPAFRALVAVLALRPASRRAGIEALASATLAAGLARALRDHIGRPRPGPRPEGGMPSRHAAAAVAIASSVGRHDPAAGRALAGAAALGLMGRVASGDHDPADILAGGALGVAAAACVAVAVRHLARTPGRRVRSPAP
jgi:membrane-associated phospholipid phosphatase